MESDNNVYIQKEWFITNQGDKKLEDTYDFNIKKHIGSGSYGDVVKAKMKGTSIRRAIKVIKKSRVKNPTRFKNEIEIMKQLDHPNVIKLFETYEDNRNIYLVMELCEGGELFDKIIAKGHFTEQMAGYYFKQMMSALNYIHSKKIVHRDLKPENFLLLSNDENAPLKMIDFGLSMVFNEEKINEKGGKMIMNTKAGTPYYISPEVLKGNYDMGCDIWSSGVILYILLSGVPPFYGNTDQDILNMVKKGSFSFDIAEFNVVSGSAKDLICKMITIPEKRLTADQTLNHPWVKKMDQNGDVKLNINMNQLKGFQSSGRMKKAVLTYIASQLNELEIVQLGKEFAKLDKNNDGVLSIEEIRNGLNDSGKMNSKEIQDILRSIDTDGSGSINYTEFIAATIEKNIYMKEDKLFSAFRMFDQDGSGKISADELRKVLGNDPNYSNVDKKYWDDMIRENDQNGDGLIDYNEFIDMMNKTKL